MQRESYLTSWKLLLCSLAAVGLVAGAVHAAETQSAPTPPGSAFTAVSVFTPGLVFSETTGVIRPGGRGWPTDEVEFSVAFDDITGEIFINGSSTGVVYDPQHRFTVTVNCFTVNDDWYADIVVVDDDLAQQVASQNGHPMSAQPTDVEVTADDVISLTVG